MKAIARRGGSVLLAALTTEERETLATKLCNGGGRAASLGNQTRDIALKAIPYGSRTYRELWDTGSRYWEVAADSFALMREAHGESQDLDAWRK